MKPAGTGWSSPVISAGQIWFTSAVTVNATPEQIAKKLEGDAMAQMKTLALSAEFHAICVDATTGQLVHDILLENVTDPDPINPMNSYASPTPAIVGDRVVCHFGNYGTWCLNTKSGEKIWETKLVVEHSVGPGSSPIVVGNKVILVCDGTDQQFVAAVNLSDGKLAWKTNRPELRANNGEFKKAYCTPLIIQVKGETLAVIPGAQWTVAYRPESGEEVWRVDCGDGFSTTPTPVFSDGLVVMSTGYMKPELVAIRPDGKGDVTQSHIAWRASKGAPTMPSFVVRDGSLYVINDSGILTCYDMKTGDEKSKVRIGGNFSSSMLLSNDKIFVSDRSGIVTVVSADAKMTTISTNDMGSQIFASHAVLGNDLILRTEDELIRITDSKARR
jgi:outer membrane protein assembly factor BamB